MGLPNVGKVRYTCELLGARGCSTVWGGNNEYGAILCGRAGGRAFVDKTTYTLQAWSPRLVLHTPSPSPRPVTPLLNPALHLPHPTHPHPSASQSTLFNALVENGKAQAANFPFCTIEPNVGIVQVRTWRSGVHLCACVGVLLRAVAPCRFLRG